MSVLVVGESLVDVVRDASRETRYPGGSPLNVACGLARLGLDVELLTRVGQDDDASLITNHLVSTGVQLAPSSHDLDPTSTATATLLPDGSAEYTFDLTWRLPEYHPENPHWVHAGSVGAFLQPGADSVENLLHAVALSSTISIDPNIRPALMPRHDEAIRRFERLVTLANVVKLSDEDAEWLYPGLSIDFVLDRLLSLGASVVALTRGAAGARMATANHTVEVAAVSVEVKDTIGAGDTFMAALIAGLIGDIVSLTSKDELGYLATRCASAAAFACARPGAQPPTRTQLELVMNRGSVPREA